MIPKPDGDKRPIGLLRSLLNFNPRRRISVADALGHPFMGSLHLESDEPEAKFDAGLWLSSVVDNSGDAILSKTLDGVITSAR